jgi:hypothetical protein
MPEIVKLLLAKKGKQKILFPPLPDLHEEIVNGSTTINSALKTLLQHSSPGSLASLCIELRTSFT